MGIVLGVDGGNSKTDVVVATTDGDPVSFVRGGGSNSHGPGGSAASIEVIASLVDLDEPADGFTIVGCGKTAMDTCNWLLDAGVDPGRIEWFRPRDPWLFNRASMQPLDLVGGYMRLQGCWVAAAAEVQSASEFMHRLEERWDRRRDEY